MTGLKIEDQQKRLYKKKQGIIKMFNLNFQVNTEILTI